jgi:hypothetical protein
VPLDLAIRKRASTPSIDRIVTLDDIVEAHRYLEAGIQVGKIEVTTAREA